MRLTPRTVFRTAALAVTTGVCVAATAAAPALAAAPPLAPTRVAADAVSLGEATISNEGKDLVVKVTYTCSDSTHLAVVAGQPPRGSGTDYERIGAATTTPTCDGQSHVVTLTATPTSTFTGTWKTGTIATVGAQLIKMANGTFTLQQADSKDLSLAG
ncbi:MULTISPECIES: hypothetical protein [Actinomadura]|uniref:Uncharacterized protein n=1 Tax=Actinomadura yumaensis TaxID=111807 RepID=A0ABW2CFX6_9ACTN|nr:hypothetical protein [Actinomadura sp. J1-007]MWK38493.1 hypothetical protein [Actinomadura sp. J1-007]